MLVCGVGMVCVVVCVVGWFCVYCVVWVVVVGCGDGCCGFLDGVG